MPITAVLLVVGAAVCHSAWNLLIKSEPRRVVVQLGAITVGTLLAVPVALAYPLIGLSTSAWVAIVASALFETAYMFSLSAAYAAGDLSLVYPVARGTATLLVAPLAMLLLGERLSPRGALGIALVVAGMVITHSAAMRSISARTSVRALALALLTGTMTCAYSLVNKVGVTLVPVPLYAFLVFFLDGVFVNVTLLSRRQPVWPFRPGGPWRMAVAVGVLMMTAYVAVLAAMSIAPVAYVVAGREVSIVVAALLGTFALGEGDAARRLSGAVVIFGGLVVMALSR